MKTARGLFVLVNLMGLLLPFLLPQFAPGKVAFWAPLLTWPIFLFCIWGGCRGKVTFTDDNNAVWKLDVTRRPARFWWALGMTSLAGWLLMLAMRAGETLG